MNRIARPAKSLLKGEGAVHSVFRSCFNVLTDSGALLLAGSSLLPLVPNAILLDDFTAEGVKPDMKVLLAVDSLAVPEAGLKFDLTEFELFEPKRGLLQGRWNGVVPALPPSFLGVHGEAALQRLLATLDSGGTPELSELIGLGQGLTPSADDVIAGIYCALQLTGTETLPDFPSGRTTLVSETLLRHLRKGEISEPPYAMVKALLSGDAAMIEDAVAKLLACGASSGAETARGILLGLGIRNKRGYANA